MRVGKLREKKVCVSLFEGDGTRRRRSTCPKLGILDFVMPWGKSMTTFNSFSYGRAVILIPFLTNSTFHILKQRLWLASERLCWSPGLIKGCPSTKLVSGDENVSSFPPGRRRIWGIRAVERARGPEGIGRDIVNCYIWILPAWKPRPISLYSCLYRSVDSFDVMCFGLAHIFVSYCRARGTHICRNIGRWYILMPMRISIPPIQLPSPLGFSYMSP